MPDTTSEVPKLVVLITAVVVVVVTFKGVVVEVALATHTGAVAYAVPNVTVQEVGEPVPVVTLNARSLPAMVGDVPQEPPTVGEVPVPSKCRPVISTVVATAPAEDTVKKPPTVKPLLNDPWPR